MKKIRLLILSVAALTLLSGCLSGHFSRTPDGTVNFDGTTVFRIKPITAPGPVGK